MRKWGTMKKRLQERKLWGVGVAGEARRSDYCGGLVLVTGAGVKSLTFWSRACHMASRAF